MGPSKSKYVLTALLPLWYCMVERYFSNDYTQTKMLSRNSTEYQPVLNRYSTELEILLHLALLTHATKMPIIFVSSSLTSARRSLLGKMGIHKGTSSNWQMNLTSSDCNGVISQQHHTKAGSNVTLIKELTGIRNDHNGTCNNVIASNDGYFSSSIA